MFELSRSGAMVGQVGRAHGGAPAAWDPFVEVLAAVDGADLTDVELVDELAGLERQVRAAAAAMARLTAELHTRRCESGASEGVPRARRGRAVGHEVALARQESPYAGREHVTMARVLVDDMPDTLAALGRGVISEAQAHIMVREASDLSPELRRVLDSALAHELQGKGDKEILRLARRLAYQLDSAAYDERARRARSRRRVTCRGTGHGMARVSGEIRAEDAIAVMDSLREFAESRRAGGDERSRDQVMADAFADRLNGSPFSDGRTVEVQVVMNAEMLLGSDATTPAHVPGYGPIPGSIARDLLADPGTSVFVRRLFAHPRFNTLVAMDSTRERFTGRLRQLLFARDGGQCRTRSCAAPARHGDHIHRRRDNGRTTLDNGQGLCEACNYAREAPGWRHRVLSRWPDPHRVEITTPCGHTYHSQAPPLPVDPSPTTHDLAVPTVVERGQGYELYRSSVELIC